VHHFALLIGYGCKRDQPVPRFRDPRRHDPSGDVLNLDHKTAIKKYIKATVKGVVKTMAKNGYLDRSELSRRPDFRGDRPQSIRHRQVFHWTPSRVEGVGLEVLAERYCSGIAALFPNAR